MKFQVEVPDEVFWRAAARAEMHDQKVSELAADLVIAASDTRAMPEYDPIIRLWRAGYTDAEVARMLNRTNLFVARRRQMYKLPANRKNGFKP